MCMANPTPTIAVDIRNITKTFGNFTALSNVSLSIQDNEFFTLLGPSGCGKTTLLRTIAGFENVTEGSILLYGEDITSLPPHERSVNTVFQHYALFPHMNVSENVMFGLRRQGHSEGRARKRAGEMLELVQLTQFANRLPSQMSGGQQQRVALARALAPNPKVLLLDEPLSALDLKLRQAVRFELQQIQHETGITFVFVTHDQEEALTMSDRIAVVSSGQLQQVGSSREIYEAPVNKFVAGFIGETNLLNVAVKSVDSGRADCLLLGGGEISCPAAEGAKTGSGHISLRPERVAVTSSSKAILTGTVTKHTYMGTDMHVEVTLKDQETVVLRLQNSDLTHIPQIDEKIGLGFEEDAARLLVD